MSESEYELEINISNDDFAEFSAQSHNDTTQTTQTTQSTQTQTNFDLNNSKKSKSKPIFNLVYYEEIPTQEKVPVTAPIPRRKSNLSSAQKIEMLEKKNRQLAIELLKLKKKRRAAELLDQKLIAQRCSGEIVEVPNIEHVSIGVQTGKQTKPKIKTKNKKILQVQDMPVECQNLKQKVSCKICGIESKNKRSLSKHITVKHGKKIQVHQNKIDTVRQEDREHKNIKSCYVLLSKLNLGRISIMKLLGQIDESYMTQMVTCEICGKELKNKRCLSKHKSTQHKQKGKVAQNNQV